MGIVEAILAVWTTVSEWFATAWTALIPIFWTAGEAGSGQFTFMGALAVLGLAVSVVFLLIGVLQRFLHLRG